LLYAPSISNGTSMPKLRSRPRLAFSIHPVPYFVQRNTHSAAWAVKLRSYGSISRHALLAADGQAETREARLGFPSQHKGPWQESLAQ